MDGVLEQLAKLSEYEARFNLSLPRVVVLGQQTAGKSSIVEALVGLPFNFTAQGMATRVPLDFQTVYAGEQEEPSWELSYEDQRRVDLTTRDVLEMLAAYNRDLFDQGRVETNPVRLRVKWRGALNLSFMDMPGLQDKGDSEAERALLDRIDMLNRKVIEEHKSNALFLVVECAASDRQGHRARNFLDRTATVDRKILLLHKLDTVRGNQADLKNTAEAIETMDTGFSVEQIFFTSCPTDRSRFGASTSTYNDCLSECTKIDKRCIASIWPNLGDQAGVLSVRKYLEREFRKMIRERVPVMERDLQNELEEHRMTLMALKTGDPRTWVKRNISKFAEAFATAIQKIWAGYLSVDNVDIQLRAFTLEKEYEELRRDIGKFSYRESPIFNDFNGVIEANLVAEKLSGSAQIRRALQEFKLCLLTAEPVSSNLVGRDERLLFVRNRRLAANDGFVRSPWSVVAQEFVKMVTEKRFDQDVLVLKETVRCIMSTWVGPALDFAGRETGGVSNVPDAVSESAKAEFLVLLANNLDRLFASLQGFIVSSIVQSTQSDDGSKEEKGSHCFDVLGTQSEKVSAIGALLENDVAEAIDERLNIEQGLVELEVKADVHYSNGCNRVIRVFETLFDTFLKNQVLDRLTALFSVWADQTREAFKKDIPEQIDEAQTALTRVSEILENLGRLSRALPPVQ